MNLSITLVVLAVCFGGVTFMIEKAEQKAKTCSVHNRQAGKVARVLGVFCGLVAVALLFGAVFLPRFLAL